MIDHRMKADWIFRGLLSLALGALAWFANGMAQEQKLFNQSINRRVTDLELYHAKIESSRFSASDWSAARAGIDSSLTSAEKRITRLEDVATATRESIGEIKQSLRRVEEKIDRITQKP